MTNDRRQQAAMQHERQGPRLLRPLLDFFRTGPDRPPCTTDAAALLIWKAKPREV